MNQLRLALQVYMYMYIHIICQLLSHFAYIGDFTRCWETWLPKFFTTVAIDLNNNLLFTILKQNNGKWASQT